MLNSHYPPSNIDQLIANVFRRSAKIAPKNIGPPMIGYQKTLQGKTGLEEITIPSKTNNIRALKYTSKTDADTLILYLHGGGWIMLDPETYDLQSRRICMDTGADVIVPDYRLAPEHPFPAAFDDCYTSYLFALEQGYKRIIIAGDSVGGAMAPGVIFKAHDEGIPTPNKVIMLSPVTDMNFESHPDFVKKASRAFMITMGMVDYQRGVYLPHEYWQHPYFSPTHGNLSILPDLLLVTGDADPLLQENTVFIEKTRKANNTETIHHVAEGYPHDTQLFLPLSAGATKIYETIQHFIIN